MHKQIGNDKMGHSCGSTIIEGFSNSKVRYQNDLMTINPQIGDLLAKSSGTSGGRGQLGGVDIRSVYLTKSSSGFVGLGMRAS